MRVRFTTMSAELSFERPNARNTPHGAPKTSATAELVRLMRIVTPMICSSRGSPVAMSCNACANADPMRAFLRLTSGLP